MSNNNKMNRKGLMLKALEKRKGIVSAAAKDCGINRATHYNWMKDDEAYREGVEEIAKVTTDYVESKLFNLIRDENAAAIMFYLRTKGKSAGYGEKVEIDGSIEVKWNEVKTYKDGTDGKAD